jgi:hypothetical protein
MEVREMHAKVIRRSRGMKSVEEKRPIVLYMDDNEDSKRALELLVAVRDTAGVPLDIDHGTPRSDEIFPTAVYRGWLYRGLEKIEILKSQFDFERRMHDASAQIEKRP